MTFEPDVAEDCLLVDGTETVRLHAATIITVEGARRGRLTLSETEFRQVALSHGDMAWNLPAESLGEVEPAQGQAIEDAAGVFWNILSVSKSPLTGVWRAVTRRQV